MVIRATSLAAPRGRILRRSLHIAEQLAERDCVVVEDFLTPRQARQLAGSCARLWRAGAFEPARIGRGEDTHRRPTVRGDHTLWLDTETPRGAQRLYLERIDALRDAINRVCFAGIHDWEGHFAVYPPGTRYARHFDRFRNDDRRIISTVFYLNESWKSGDGGELLAWLPHTVEPTVIAVPPNLGTLVVFRSDIIAHEVLVTTKDRASIAGWFRTRA